MLKIVLLGSPGSGKGTQAELLSNKFGLQHISTGELLRKAIFEGSELGVQAQHLINSGKLVSDQIIIDLVKQSLLLAKEKLIKGLILDGFPRNVSQAQALELVLPIDWVIYLNVPDHIIINRLAGRRYHPKSGRVYHIEYNPPLIAELDDFTQEPLVIRADDQPEVVQQRLLIYHQTTEPLINWYSNLGTVKFIEVDGSCDKLGIFNKILNEIVKHLNL